MARVLLIEPDKLLAANLRQALAKRGHEVIWQTTAQAALVSADLKVPDIVVLEPHLALHSGIEFLYEFRSYPDWQTVPVVIYSQVPWEDSGSARAKAELEVSDFCPKSSTSLAQLADRLEQILQPKPA